ncbi:hypothetical protein [Oceaniserpentilla sp. 4NH20-0058]|uniref:hypothetical protein n=1 Tax=Oceaniserpentilla sp. 4NH20-0058 TaxID=3127660 RepID=UPI00333F9354
MLASAFSYSDVNITSQLDYEGTGYVENSKIDESNSTSFNHSLSFNTEIYSEIADGQSVTFKPFFRWDENDDERTHGDIRELIWHKVADTYELKAGIGKVFWGVTESQHLVDIINQTDGVESLDGEQKLGQPMVQLLLERDWGNLDLFVLPFHRERTFVGKEGRLGAGLDYADGIYESSEEERHIDVAARFYTYIDEFEYAVSLFHGTSREAAVGFDLIQNKLLPYYPEITQLGVEMQYLAEGWAWKFEGIVRDGMPESSLNGFPVVFDGINLSVAESDEYFATTAGFEYTQVGIWDTRIDLGWVVEHIYDSRSSDVSPTTFDNEVLLATRWAANDAESSILLAGVLLDEKEGDYSLSVEGSTRVLQNMTMAIEARIFSPNEDSQLWAFRDEDFIKLTFSYYL